MPFANTRFHAIGQGCFYSGEIFCTENSVPLRLVYDCGTETDGDALEREVSLLHQLLGDANLDVLVLSHLDADHVNGLTLLLDKSVTTKNVFLPYLTPMQRAIAAASAGKEADPEYFELLADPVRFLEGRGVENIIFISGDEDEQGRSSEEDVPPFEPTGDDGNSPNLADLEGDKDGESRFYKGEGSKIGSTSGRPSRTKLPLDSPQAGSALDSRTPQRATLHFKTDRKPFRLTNCWQAKFFHRDDMRSALNAIYSNSDFTIRADDSRSVMRYKAFLEEVRNRFGTLDPGRLIMAIRNKSDRRKLRACYHHIRANHNDVSLVLWHGPRQTIVFVRLRSSMRNRSSPNGTFAGCNGGTLLTGDLTCTKEVVGRMERHFGSKLRESAFIQVPHHGSLKSWNTQLLAVTDHGVMPVISAGSRNGYGHPHPQVVDSLTNWRGGVDWFVTDERNPISMRVDTI
jgi:beta-lactamase superfamily II metal-dependent hydrolase